MTNFYDKVNTTTPSKQYFFDKDKIIESLTSAIIRNFYESELSYLLSEKAGTE
jgi:hypothetical protein